MFDFVIIAGFVFAAAVLYFCAGKLIDRIDPFSAENETKAQTVYQIAIQDIIFLKEIERFLDQNRCMFYTGSQEEILSGMKSTRMDAVILSEDAPVSSRELMNCLKGKYYSSVLSIHAEAQDIQILSHKPHSITIYYHNCFRSVLDAMISQGVLVAGTDEHVYE